MQATQEQIIEGTAEEIAMLLQGGAFAGRRLRLHVELSEAEADEESSSVDFSDLPNSVRDRAHLTELIQAGLDSPTHPVTAETWEQLRGRIQSEYCVTPGLSNDGLTAGRREEARREGEYVNSHGSEKPC